MAMPGIEKKVELNGEEERKIRLRPLRTTEGSVNDGTLGLIVNHYPVSLKKMIKFIFHYDVTITSVDSNNSNKTNNAQKKDESEGRQMPDRVLPIIWKQFEKVYCTEAEKEVAMPFDGKKNCYSVEKLDLNDKLERNWKITMNDPDDDDKIRKFNIRIKFTNEIVTSKFNDFMNSRVNKERVDLAHDVIQALDIALRSSPSNNHYCCNRSFFGNARPYKLDQYLDLHYGHYQSLTPGSDVHPTLNIDLACKAFVRKMPVIEMMCRLFRVDDQSFLNENFWTKEKYCLANELLAGKLIEYGTGHKDPITGKYERNHKFPAIEFLKYTSNTFEFTDPSCGKVSIANYFQNEKNTKITRPNIPVLHVGSKYRTNYVPIELCVVTEQPYKGKMEASLTSAMIKGSAKAPKERFQKIQTSRDACHYETCPVLNAFGLVVSPLPMKIESARRLPPPLIRIKSKDVCPDKKTGTWGLKNGSFFQPAEVPQWAILDTIASSTDRRNPDVVVNKFFETLAKDANQLGLRLGSAHHYVSLDHICPNPSGPSRKDLMKKFTEEIDDKLKELKDAGNLLVFVIISNDGREYAVVKSAAEVKIGILTSCVMQKTLHGNRQTINNLLLKINAKLGGENFRLSPSALQNFFSTPVLVMGADVTHPASNSNTPSFAAVTASTGMSGMTFGMHIQAQNSKQEIIKDMRKITKEMLQKFKKVTKRAPKKILMFRDGVSEGYFDAIKENEYMAIKNACSDLNPNYEPNITFVVVKKRHHTRFCPKDPEKDGVGRPMNVPPGTIVDTRITHPVEQEFFLNSHVGIQGTSRPTRYHVIHDDSNFTMDQIQLLSYSLCYMFVRCSQPVSYPALTYYAHLAAFRARTLVSQEGDSADLNALAEKLVIHPDLQNQYPMFFV